MKSLKRKLTLITFLSIQISFLSFAQSPSDTTITADTSDDDFSFISINASYTSNNLEYVTGLTEKIPSLFTNLSYVNKTGLYLGGAYSKYFNANVQTYDFNIEAGYQKYFDNGFDVDFYYSKHGFSGDTLLEGISYDHSLNLSSGIDLNKFYLSADFSYLIATKNNSFFDINFSRFIQIDKILFNSDVFLINPSVSLTFGTDYWLYDNMTPQEKFSVTRDLKLNEYSYNSFSYEGFDILIPISYGIGNTYLSLSWLYRIPADKYKYLGWENQSSFMFSLTYFLNFTH